jgi:hypothetical protein
MPVQILGALVIADFGAPARLRVWQEPGPKEGALEPAPLTLPHSNSRDALSWAHLYVSSVIGWPLAITVRWSIANAVGPTLRLPPLRGPSVFGAFSLAFLRSVAVDSPGSIKPGATKLADLIADTRTDEIAVSAAFNPFSGRFDNVGSIELKLAALTWLGPQTCKLLVVSQPQPIQLELVTKTEQYEVYCVDGRLSIPVVHAIDPVDALQKVFYLQSVAALTC